MPVVTPAAVTLWMSHAQSGEVSVGEWFSLPHDERFLSLGELPATMRAVPRAAARASERRPASRRGAPLRCRAPGTGHFDAGPSGARFHQPRNLIMRRGL